jgi:hypothetical protein
MASIVAVPKQVILPCQDFEICLFRAMRSCLATPVSCCEHCIAIGCGQHCKVALAQLGLVEADSCINITQEIRVKFNSTNSNCLMEHLTHRHASMEKNYEDTYVYWAEKPIYL